MRILVIHNPLSGPKGEDIYSFVRSTLAPDDELVMRLVGGSRDVRELTADAASFDAVVASGGDGTVARAAYAVRDAGVPVLVFPSGTANLLANNLGNATEPAALAATLRAGTTVRMDMGELTYADTAGQAHSCGFLTMAGAGYDASIMRGSEDLKPLFGQLSYYLAALGNAQAKSSHFRLTLDGKVVEADGISVLVGVWGTIGPTMQIIPGSNPTDGLLDVAIIKAQSPIEALPAAISAALGQGVGTIVETHHVREATIECDPPMSMQFDGEVIEGAQTPFSVRVLPGALSTFVDKLSPYRPQD